MPKQTIKTYNPRQFTTEFMPPAETQQLIKGGFGNFFIVRVEEMYQSIKRPVPASRSTAHSIIYLTEGEANMHIGSGRYSIQAHEMLFVPAGQVFSFGKGDVNKGYLCNFTDDMLAGKFGNADLLKGFEFLRVWGNHKISLGKQTSQFILHILKRLLLEYSANGLDNLGIIQPYFITLLCEVNTAYKPGVSSGKTAAVNIANQFRELIFKHITTKHLVADYAALLHISPNHLNKSVKEVTLKPATKWIDEAIVLEAKVLLSQSNLSISEVANTVGIEDPSYFARLFKKYEGVTPSVFRRMIETSYT